MNETNEDLRRRIERLEDALRNLGRALQFGDDLSNAGHYVQHELNRSLKCYD